MLSHDELEKIREEQEVMETWRSYSRHVVADLLEACAICGAVREKVEMSRCRWCEDTYICKDGFAPKSTRQTCTLRWLSGHGRKLEVRS